VKTADKDKPQKEKKAKTVIEESSTVAREETKESAPKKVYFNSEGTKIKYPKTNNTSQTAASSSSSSSSSSSTHQDIQPVRTDIYATKATSGRRGHRNFIDYDPRERKKQIDESSKPKKRSRSLPSTDGLEGGVFFW
jgi:hypothetical protein